MRNALIILAILVISIIAYFVIGSYYLNVDESAMTETEEVTEEENLTSSSWSWQHTDLLSGEKMTAPAGDKFVLSFQAEGRMGSLTDCNSIGGIYSIDGEVLSMGQFAMTKMFCEGSAEMEYANQLGLANSYIIEGDELRLNLNRDYGVMVFKRHND